MGRWIRLLVHEEAQDREEAVLPAAEAVAASEAENSLRREVCMSLLEVAMAQDLLDGAADRVEAEAHSARNLQDRSATPRRIDRRRSSNVSVVPFPLLRFPSRLRVTRPIKVSVLCDQTTVARASRDSEKVDLSLTRYWLPFEETAFASMPEGKHRRTSQSDFIEQRAAKERPCRTLFLRNIKVLLVSGSLVVAILEVSPFGSLRRRRGFCARNLSAWERSRPFMTLSRLAEWSLLRASLHAVRLH